MSDGIPPDFQKKPKQLFHSPYLLGPSLPRFQIDAHNENTAFLCCTRVMRLPPVGTYVQYGTLKVRSGSSKRIVQQPRSARSLCLSILEDGGPYRAGGTV